MRHFSLLRLGSGFGWWKKEKKQTRTDSDRVAVFSAVFGPIMLILSYETVDQAVEIANSSRYGYVSVPSLFSGFLSSRADLAFILFVRATQTRSFRLRSKQG